jgi:hypothetical protein
MLTVDGRAFVALRKHGQKLLAGRTPLYHAVTPQCRVALCATEPGAGSGWAEPASDTVNCPACVARLSRLLNRSRL